MNQSLVHLLAGVPTEIPGRDGQLLTTIIVPP
jgi:hypothetical protein